MNLKSAIRKLLPDSFWPRYHRLITTAAGWYYGHPSDSMIVIGVTGTNGKTTTANLICRILESTGHRVGLATTANFRVAGREWLNTSKMTMLGRTQLQELLASMVDAGCRYAVVETSSEGIKQERHAGINYDIAVFTNLTPEHLEAHGGFENYKAAKGRLFAKLSTDAVKTLSGEVIPKLAVVNARDVNAAYFLERAGTVDKRGFFAELPQATGGVVVPSLGRDAVPLTWGADVVLAPAGSAFVVDRTQFHLRLAGGFNVENAMAAITVGQALGVSLPAMAKVLSAVEVIPGRLEFIQAGQPFQILVDYAPEPESLRQLYEVVKSMPHKRIIHVVGSCGGGRDRDRRPVMGKLAADNADFVIVTNEDPYDDMPKQIIAEVAAGAIEAGKRLGDNLMTVEDRAMALQLAVDLAQPGDLVLATGKGAEQAICVANGRKIPWDEREMLRQAVQRRFRNN